MQENKPSPSKAYLFSSLGLIVLYIGLSIAYYTKYGFDTIDDDVVSKLAGSLPLYLVFLFVIFIAPVYEELAFRFWVTGKRRAFWISAILIVVFGLLMGFYLVIAIGAGLLVYLSLEKPLKLTNAKGVVFFVLSSLSFALAHLSLDNPMMYSVIQVVYYMGVGGLFAYVGLRYGFRYSLVSHILFNAVIVFIAFFADNQKDLHFTIDADTEVSLTANSIFSSRSSLDNVLNDDSMYYEGTLTGILIGISPEKNQYLMVDNGFGLYRHTLTATSKTGAIDRSNLRDALVERLPIKIDTTEVDAFCLTFDEQFDGGAPNPKENKQKPHSLNSLAYMIRMNHKLPVLVCDTLEQQDKLVQIDIDFYFIKSESALKTYLQDRGVLINLESDRQIKRIEFEEKY